MDKLHFLVHRLTNSTILFHPGIIPGLPAHPLTTLAAAWHHLRLVANASAADVQRCFDHHPSYHPSFPAPPLCATGLVQLHSTVDTNVHLSLKRALRKWWLLLLRFELEYVFETTRLPLQGLFWVIHIGCMA